MRKKGKKNCNAGWHFSGVCSAVVRMYTPGGSYPEMVGPATVLFVRTVGPKAVIRGARGALLESLPFWTMRQSGDICTRMLLKRTSSACIPSWRTIPASFYVPISTIRTASMVIGTMSCRMSTSVRNGEFRHILNGRDPGTELMYGFSSVNRLWRQRPENWDSPS